MAGESAVESFPATVSESLKLTTLYVKSVQSTLSR